jgi:hypothetical protein
MAAALLVAALFACAGIMAYRLSRTPGTNPQPPDKRNIPGFIGFRNPLPRLES